MRNSNPVNRFILKVLVGPYQAITKNEDFQIFERLQGSNLPHPRSPIGKLRNVITGEEVEGEIYAERQVAHRHGAGDEARNNSLIKSFRIAKYAFFVDSVPPVQMKHLTGILIEECSPAYDLPGRFRTEYRPVILRLKK